MAKSKTGKRDFDNPGAANRFVHQKRSEGYNAEVRSVRGKGFRALWSGGFINERRTVEG
jgi:hypothetical protein